MTHGPSAEIAYGYFLGGPCEWEFDQASEFGGIDPEKFPWFDSDDESFGEAIERRLGGSTPPGVSVTWCGGSPGYLFLYAHRLAQSSYCAQDFDATDMAGDVASWNNRLDRALEHLGMTLSDERPGWHLLLSWE